MEKLKLACLDKTGNFYVVCKGDNLRTIAEKFSTTENLIINDNYLKNPIKIGEKLYIKSYKKTYQVSPCDTLKSIALKFNVSEQKILEINKITYIYAGERIVIL